MTAYTGGEMVAEYMAKEGVPYAVGLPGHAIATVVDAIGKRGIKMIQAKNEESACHLADGFFRASGKPLVVFATAGAGATNTILGLATAWVDSSAFVLITGEVSSYFYGYGTFQGTERSAIGDFNSIVRPVTKGTWNASRADVIPEVMARAFKLCTSGRPGPVHVSIPMDVAAQKADVTIPEPSRYRPEGTMRADEATMQKVSDMILNANRPIILSGGGVANSGATAALIDYAEFLGIPVMSTELGLGKGTFPEDHELYAFYPGSPGSSVGNMLARNADVILSLGCRFTEFTASSYKQGATFSIPPTKLIQVDIDAGEIGKNYPVEVGVVADAKAVLQDLLSIARRKTQKRNYRQSEYFKQLQTLKGEWFEDLKSITEEPTLTMGSLVTELRDVLDRKAIVVESTSYSISVVSQLFPVYEPRSHIASGGFGPMGFGLPAAMGAKLARPDRQVVDVDGDGAFLFRVGELSTCVQYDIPVLAVVCNNRGFISVKDSQAHMFNRSFVVDFKKPNGELYSPDYAKVAEAFGCFGTRITKREEVKDAVKKALSSGKPAVIDAVIARDFPKTGTKHYGFWHGISPEAGKP
ncbi:MAG: thiamine pyrophosphate-binding protein [Nitrososphaerales archaeon]|nr:thiamine pyrophosphate-binding protein [Nitrososphaerales archaeon]